MAYVRGADNATGRDAKPIKTRKGECWEICWRDLDNRHRSKRLYASRRAAELEAKRLSTRKADGVLADDRKGKQTFAEVADKWLRRRTNARPETVDKYRSILFGREGAPSRIAIAFGNRRIDSITEDDLLDFVTSLRNTTIRKGRSLRPASIERTLWPLRAVLRYAHARGWIVADPTSGDNAPTAPTHTAMGLRKFEHRPLEPDEVDALAAWAATTHPTFGLVVRVLCFTGLRSAELAGLNVSDVRLLHRNGPQLRVERTRKLAGGEWVINVPKSERSVRNVPLVPELVEPLAAYLAAHPRKDEPDAPLFYGRTPGGNHRDFDPARPLDPNAFYKSVWRPGCKGLGIVRSDGTAPRLHDARHTAASLWIASGESLVVVSRILGHANVATTETVYVELLRGSGEAAATRLGGFLEAERARVAARSEVVSLDARRSS